MSKFWSISLGLLLAVAGTACGKTEKSAPETTVAVRTMRPEMREFQEIVATQGIVEPVEQAVLSALTPGKLEYLKVKEGDAVKKGDLLFISDRQTLQNRCTLAEETLKMARQRLLTREADVNLAQVNFDKAKTDFQRSSELFRSQAVSKDAYERAELAHQKALLTIDQAKASLATARAEVSFAGVTLNIARKRLEDAEFRAPYDAVITAKMKNENEFCNAGTPVLKIEAPGRKRITAAISGIHYGAIAVGKTRVEVSFAGEKIASVPVTILSRTIDAVSRTLELKADLPAEVKLPSGTLCDLKIVLAERTGTALPEDALIYQNGGGFAVYAVSDGKAQLLPVQPGITQNNCTEIINAETLRDRDIIVSGQYFVENGTPVRAVK